MNEYTLPFLQHLLDHITRLAHYPQNIFELVILDPEFTMRNVQLNVSVAEPLGQRLVEERQDRCDGFLLNFFGVIG